jgi:hypothetical protein
MKQEMRILSALRVTLMALMVLIALSTASATVASDQGSADEHHKKKIVTRVVTVVAPEDGEGEADVMVVGGHHLDPMILGPGFHRHSYLGVSLLEMTAELRRFFGAPEDAGVLISEVAADSPAAVAGLQAGDVLTAIDGEQLSHAGEVMREIGRREENETVRLEIWRDGRLVPTEATLVARKRSQVDLGRFYWHEGDGHEGDGQEVERRVLRFGPGDLPHSIVEIEPGVFDEALGRLHEQVKSPEWRERIHEMANRREDLEERILELEQRLREMEQRLQDLPEE